MDVKSSVWVRPPPSAHHYAEGYVVRHIALASWRHFVMHYVYILKLSNGKYYMGRSDDLRRRVKEHMLGQERTTKRFLPCKLVCYMAFDERKTAVAFEAYLKTGSDFAFRNRHLV